MSQEQVSHTANAEPHLARDVDRLAAKLIECASESEFVDLLFAHLEQHVPHRRRFYVGLGPSGAVVHSEFRGYPSLSSVPGAMISRDYWLDSAEFNRLISVSGDSEASGLQLHQGGRLLALVGLETLSEQKGQRDDLMHLGLIGSMALASLRHRVQLDEATAQLSWLLNWSQEIHRFQGRLQQLEELLDKAVLAMGADKGSIMLLDETSGELVVRAAVGVEPHIQQAIRSGQHSCRRLKLGEGVAGQVAQSLFPMVVHEVESDTRFLQPELTQLTSIACLPLHVEGVVMGVLNLTIRGRDKRFLPEHLETGTELAEQLARAIYNCRLYQAATSDSLTGVASRGHLYNRVGEETLRSRRYGRNLALLAIGVDGLELVRTELGHGITNDLQKQFAELLAEATRETDLVARLSEFSFAVLMPETGAAGGKLAAERICQALGDSSLFENFPVTTSIGVCAFPEGAESGPSLIARAEMAMQAAAGKDDGLRICVAPPVVPSGESSEATPVRQAQ